MPTAFGNFEILHSPEGELHLLGKGTFGRTYMARHRFLEIPVALKVINERYAAVPSVRHRFLVEARAIAKLAHPNIARILDFGETQGVLHYAMEYCAGGNLSEYVEAHGPLDVATALSAAQQTAAALHCAHKAGFVHRDLKPSNLMRAEADGPFCVKLIDFGLVQAESVPAPAEADGEEQRFVGTPLFASPEQLREQPLDARTDLFSLGMTLWFLLRGDLPEKGSFGVIATSRLNAESYESQLPRGLPEALRRILAQLLEKDADRRFQSAAELLADLNRCALALGRPVVDIPLEAESPSRSAGPAATPALAPLDLETVDSTVTARFTIVRKEGDSPLGTSYIATSNEAPDQNMLLQILRKDLVDAPGILPLILERAGRAAGLELEALLRPRAARQFTDGVILELAPPSGESLFQILRNKPILKLAEAQGLLLQIATHCDRIMAAGLPGIDFTLSRIHVIPPAEGAEAGAGEAVRMYARLLSAAEIHAVVGDSSADDVAATMASDTMGEPDKVDDILSQFGLLLYRVFAGRVCPVAATVSSQGYVAVPGLSEQSNRILALAVSGGSTYGACLDFLNDLLAAEGAAGVGAHGSLSSKGTQARSVASQSMMQTRPPHRLPEAAASIALSSAGAHPLQRGVSSHSVPGQPAEPAPKAGPKPLILAAVGVVAVGILGGAYFALKSPSADQGASKTEESQSAGNSTAKATLPADSVLRVQGDIPANAMAELDGNSLRVEQSGNEWRINLGPTPRELPLEVKIMALGYAPLIARIEKPGDLSEIQKLSATRATGDLVVVREGPSDYSRAVIKMVEVLPEQEGKVELERFPRGKELGQSSQETIALSTGVYQVTFKGANDRVIAPRRTVRVEIREGLSVRQELPPSVAGQYKGKVNLANSEGSGEEAERELRIEPGLSGGWVIEQRPGAPSLKAELVNPRLDADGVYHATIAFSILSGITPRYDEEMTLRVEAGGDYTLESAESLENESIERLLKRKPNSTLIHRGTLRRVSTQAPAP